MGEGPPSHPSFVKTTEDEVKLWRARGVRNSMGKSTKIKSSYIRFGRRTYFFDVNQKSESDKMYLRITESQFLGEGKERKYNSFILFPEDLQDFQKNLKEAAGSLTEA